MPAIIICEDKKLTIQIDGQLNHSLRNDLGKAYEYAEVDEFVIDCKRASYADSSGLGLLLGLRTLAIGRGIKNIIRIINCNSAIKEALNISGFDKYFDIE